MARAIEKASQEATNKTMDNFRESRPNGNQEVKISTDMEVGGQLVSAHNHNCGGNSSGYPRVRSN